ncbi:hypothetical protein DNFV4_00684 [Nitrospira tepida]|uniref:Uncharacterized protein n=1 Tax=Nitrospira tepida TaxID=2973512 RepID=A0AA86MWH8_9BACT|nr:hypothetical protein [Nitrospira tepida]CAI4030256.1 hypothetical protein DNFV4_00684 [Nitrospira tepida]
MKATRWSQVPFGLVLALCAHFIAILLVGGVSVEYLVVFGVAFVLVGLIFDLAIKVVVRSTERSLAPFKQRYDSVKARISALSLSEAKRRALTLLEDGSKFVCIRRATTEDPHLEGLPQGLKDFFGQFESVEAVEGELQLRRADICNSKFNPEFIRVGAESDFREIVVRPNEESIFVIDGSESDLYDWPRYAHRSIFHFLLLQGELLDIKTKE